MRLIIDAHLDISWNAVSYNRDQTEELNQINQRELGMTDSRAREGACVCLPEMRRGGVAVCLATVLCRAKRDVQPLNGPLRCDLDYGTQNIAYAASMGQLAYYRALERSGQMTQIKSAADLDAHWSRWQVPEKSGLPIGYILAMEGADPIIEPEEIDLWWNEGLRSLILAHYGTGHYADGTGCEGGLTKKGEQLLAEMQRVGMIMDVTHTTDRSFEEAMDRFGGPVMASHSNCRTLAPRQRQLNDEQINTLIQRGCVFGISMDAWMIAKQWTRGETSNANLSLAAVIDHMDHYCQLAGNASHVAIGSDLDGGFGAAQRPKDVGSIADLQRLGELLADRGYADDDIDRILHRNWLEFFQRHLPAT